MPNAAATDRIAAAIHLLRPDWPKTSIATLIERDPALSNRGFQDLAVALTYVATDPKSSTPARVKENGPWWRATAETPADARSGPPTPHTPRCPLHPHEPVSCGCCRSEWLAGNGWPEGTHHPDSPEGPQS